MTPDQSTRLAKVLGMTGSVHDAEALTALRMATALLAQAGMSWKQLLTGNGKSGDQTTLDAFNDGYAQGCTVGIPAAQENARREGYEKGYAEGWAKGLLARKNSPAARPRAWRAIVEDMLGEHTQKLTEWEEKFLQSFLYRRWHTPTPRQRDVLERIAHKCGVSVPQENQGEASARGDPPW